MKYAVIRTGGKQYRVSEGDIVKVEKLTGEVGEKVTLGDVLFIGATVYDKKFRAFDSLTGKLLWETVLPYAAVATPATYMIDGKQYVVVTAGGGKDPKGSSGSVYVAFALP